MQKRKNGGGDCPHGQCNSTKPGVWSGAEVGDGKKHEQKREWGRENGLLSC
jgi:hypothetical protein